MTPTTRYGNPLWIGPLGSATGFGEEGRGFVCALRRHGVPLAAAPLELAESTFLPVLAQDFPDQIRALNDATSQALSAPVTAIVHVGAASIPAPPSGVDYAVCRTMWETDSLTPVQVALLNTYDEVWVPTSFNEESFARAGVRAKLVVVPGGVDTSVFRPGVPKLQIPGLGKDHKVFLSMFEWSHRKAPDVLLRAWAEAFSPADDVTLLLRCYPRNEFESTEDLTGAIYAEIDRLLAEHGLSRDDLAPIAVLGRRLSPRQIPALYAAADCYVAPARGEGWGRPLTEAMAMGLPIIATRWSAPLDFLTDDNALLLDIEGLELVDERMDVPHYRGQHWASPSATHLAELLRSVVDDPDEAARLAKKARQDAVEHWQWRRVAQLAAAELERIEHERHAPPALAFPPDERVASPPATADGAADFAACTVVTHSHLPWARVLARSFTAQHPDKRLQVVVTDDLGQHPPLGEEPFDLLRLDDLDLPQEQLSLMALIYQPTELACALKPWALSRLLETHEAALYLDADIRVYRPLDDAAALAARHEILLTPHILRPLPRDGRLPDETVLLASGMFNLGFIALGRGSDEFQAFWKERLRDDCLNDREHGRASDQRWVDFVPPLFRHHVWRDPATNVAYWNLHERPLSRDERGRFLAGGEPVSFFHFSGFDPLLPFKLTRHQGDRPRVDLASDPVLSDLVEDYRSELLAAGYRRGALETYGYATLPTGEVLTKERRRAYREAILAQGAVAPVALASA